MNAISRIGLLAYVAAAFFVSANFNTVRADDTDIYVKNTVAPEAAPLVMFSIDYRPNLGSTICTNVSGGGCTAVDYFKSYPKTAPYVDELVAKAGDKLEYFDMLRLALHVTLQQITGVKVGLMMNHDDEGGCSGPGDTSKGSAANPGCSNGGFIVQGFQELQTDDANGAFADFEQTLFAIPLPQGNVSHDYQGKELYFEFFRYLTGHQVYNGFNGYRDFGSTDGTKNVDHVDEYPEAAWDTSIISSEFNGSKQYWRYISPFTTSNECVQAFAINFYGGTTNKEDDSDAAIKVQDKTLGGMAGINLDGKNNSFETVIAYLRDADLADGTYGDTRGSGAAPDLDGKQGVISYFLTQKPVKADNDRAIAGGTAKALKLTDDPKELVNTLTDIFDQILSVSTTFVAASVPVNVFNRAESLDNVFIALFQADADNKPFWPGNLKKLKLAVVKGDDGSQIVELQDKNGKAAISPTDGRIKYDALTYWTDPNQLPEPTPDTEEVALRDGRVVERGAAGQKIPGFISNGIGLSNGTYGTEPLSVGPRTVFYESGEGALKALNVDATTRSALKTALGATTDDEADGLLRWLRGVDDTGNVRPWILGDPLHSRPLPINYGLRGGHEDKKNPLIYIAMASNDGYMHFIRNTDGSGTDAGELGKEVWAFVPTEIMGEIKTLKENVVPPSDAPRKHPYTVDGAPSAFLMDIDGNGTIGGSDKVYLYFGLRRGGKAYYALDVTDPDRPALAWKIKSGDSNFTELGQSWSRPQVGYMDHNGDGTKDPVVIFAGGYDERKDARGGTVPSTDASELGNTVYIVDATEGTLIWKATHTKMVDSIPSDVTTVDTNSDGMIDRILVGDTGGNVWRIDTFDDKSNWQATLLASVGRHYSATVEHDRRFFHRPDFVQSRGSFEQDNEDGTTETVTKNYDAVIIGSGNRPNPLDQEYTTPPTNYMYVIRDTRTTPANASSDPALVVNDLNYDHDSFGDITSLANEPTNAGWKLKLEVAVGEKSLSTPLTLSNVVYFTTYLPKAGREAATCGPDEGGGLLYAVNLQTGRAANNYNTTDDNDNPDGSASDRYKELSSAGIPADVVGISVDGQPYVLPPDLTPEKAQGASRWRTFWYEVENSDL